MFLTVFCHATHNSRSNKFCAVRI